MGVTANTELEQSVHTWPAALAMDGYAGAEEAMGPPR